jgi:hypothetical protein
VSQLAGSGGVVEHGTSRPGRWLRARRNGIALWVAVLEAIIVALLHDVSRWTVIVLAVVAVVLWLYAGRSSRSDTVRQVTWIFAASQLLALVAVILAFILFWTALILAAIFALVALFFLFVDRPK